MDPHGILVWRNNSGHRSRDERFVEIGPEPPTEDLSTFAGAAPHNHTGSVRAAGGTSYPQLSLEGVAGSLDRLASPMNGSGAIAG